MPKSIRGWRKIIVLLWCVFFGAILKRFLPFFRGEDKKGGAKLIKISPGSRYPTSGPEYMYLITQAANSYKGNGKTQSCRQQEYAITDAACDSEFPLFVINSFPCKLNVIVYCFTLAPTHMCMSVMHVFGRQARTKQAMGNYTCSNTL